MEINGKEYKLFYNLYGEFAYEQNAGHRFPYGQNTLFDEIRLFYSMLYACNDDFDISFEEFVKACNEDLTLLVQFREVIKEAFARMTEFQKKKTE